MGAGRRRQPQPHQVVSNIADTAFDPVLAARETILLASAPFLTGVLLDHSHRTGHRNDDVFRIKVLARGAVDVVSRQLPQRGELSLVAGIVVEVLRRLVVVEAEKRLRGESRRDEMGRLVRRGHEPVDVGSACGLELLLGHAFWAWGGP